MSLAAKAIAVYVPDLWFWSRLEPVLTRAGWQPRRTQSPEGLAELMALTPPMPIVVDLTAPNIPWSALASHRVFGFYPHVRTDLRQTAQRAGIEQLVANGAALRVLPRFLEKLEQG